MNITSPLFIKGVTSTPETQLSPTGIAPCPAKSVTFDGADEGGNVTPVQIPTPPLSARPSEPGFKSIHRTSRPAPHISASSDSDLSSHTYDGTESPPVCDHSPRPSFDLTRALASYTSVENLPSMTHSAKDGSPRVDSPRPIHSPVSTVYSSGASSQVITPLEMHKKLNQLKDVGAFFRISVEDSGHGISEVCLLIVI